MAWILCILLVLLNFLREAEGSPGPVVALYCVILYFTLVLLNVESWQRVLLER